MDAHVAHCEHETLEVANFRYRLALGAAMEDLGMAEFPNATARKLRGPDASLDPSDPRNDKHQLRGQASAHANVVLTLLQSRILLCAQLLPPSAAQPVPRSAGISH